MIDGYRLLVKEADEYGVKFGLLDETGDTVGGASAKSCALGPATAEELDSTPIKALPRGARQRRDLVGDLVEYCESGPQPPVVLLQRAVGA